MYIYGAWYLAMLDYLSQSFYNYNSMKLKILFSANDSRSWYICYCISYSWKTSQRKKIRQYFLLLEIPYLIINVHLQLNKNSLGAGTMGRIYLEHLGGSRLFTCANCDTYLTNKGELISTRFTGATGRAFLFNKVVNLSYG